MFSLKNWHFVGFSLRPYSLKRWNTSSRFLRCSSDVFPRTRMSSRKANTVVLYVVTLPRLNSYSGIGSRSIAKSKSHFHKLICKPCFVMKAVLLRSDGLIGTVLANIQSWRLVLKTIGLNIHSLQASPRIPRLKALGIHIFRSNRV